MEGGKIHHRFYFPEGMEWSKIDAAGQATIEKGCARGISDLIPPLFFSF
jgi:hypothetical protein